jgi:hypothetical protein
VNNGAQRPDLRRLVPVPTYSGEPSTTVSDIEGLDLDGAAVSRRVIESKAWHLLMFLSTSCDGCLDLWQGMAAPHQFDLDDVVVTALVRGDDHDDKRRLRELSSALELVVSPTAWKNYRVTGPPFFVVVDGWRNKVATEGVAWGMEATVGYLRTATTGSPEAEVPRLLPPESEH